MKNVGNSWMQKKDRKTTQYNLLALKGLVSKLSEKIVIEAFKKTENVFKNKNEFKSNK